MNDMDEHPPSRKCDCPECRAYFDDDMRQPFPDRQQFAPELQAAVLDCATTPATFRCLGCGASYVPTFPVPVSMFAAMCDAFARDHRGCKVSAAAHGQPPP